MDISERLKEARQNTGLTQEQVAEKIMVSRVTVSHWENGKSLPDIVSLISLSDLYCISLDELVKGDSKMTEKIRKDAKDRAEAQASQIIGQANIDAQTVREESLIEKRRLESEIEAIKQAKNNMKRSVFETMQKYDDLLRRMNTEMENE